MRVAKRELRACLGGSAHGISDRHGVEHGPVPHLRPSRPDLKRGKLAPLDSFARSTRPLLTALEELDHLGLRLVNSVRCQIARCRLAGSLR